MSRNHVNRALTPHRRRDVVENDAYAAFTRRVLRAYARRVGAGDVEALTAMVALSHDIDRAVHHAVTGLRGFGYSWAEIGTRLGISRQAVQQRWGNTRNPTYHDAPTRRPDAHGDPHANPR